MTPQFTTNCYVRVDDAQQRREVCEKLEQYGYDVFRAINNPSGDMIFTDLFFSDGTYSNEPTYAIWKNHMVKELQKTHIDCGTNEALFLDLAAMRSDTNKGQWVVSNVKHAASPNFKMIRKGSREFIDMDTWFDYTWTLITDTHSRAIDFTRYHKATAQEIIEWHKQKGETK